MTANIFIVRHGDAEFTSSDQSRRLTNYGAELLAQTSAFILGALNGSKITKLIASPYRRAMETAMIIADIFPSGVEVEEDKTLIPNGDYVSFALYLNSLELTQGNYIIVSHLPFVGLLCEELTGQNVAFATGTVVKISTDEQGKFILKQRFSPK